MLRPGEETTTRARYTVFAIWQLPTLLLVSVAVAVLWADDAVPRPWLSLAVPWAIVAAASVLALVLPWERWTRRGRMLVPLLDVVGVALLEFEGVLVVPEISLLGILPLVWLAFEFAWAGVVAALVSATVVAVYSTWRGPRIPQTVPDWLSVFLLPAVALVLVFVAQLAANTLRHNRRQLLERSRDLALALQTAQDRLVVGRGILETVDAAICFYDADGRFEMGNRVAEELAARGGFRFDVPPYSGPEVRRGDRTTPLPPEEQAVPRALAGEAIHGELQWFGDQAEQVAVIISVRQVEREDGGLLGTVVAAWDVTDLLESVRVREEFLATVSHELRTPLTSIVGYVEIAEDQAAGDRLLQSTLEVIARNAETLLERISDLLSAAPTAGMVLHHEDADLSVVVSEVVEEGQPAAHAAGLSLDAEVPAGVRARVDAARVKQVVENLVSNAVKYTDDGGVTVSLRRDGDDQVVLAVADTGPGMTEAERRRAFDRFYRTESARGGAAGGLGIGLALVAQVVSAHGGRVSLDDRPGGGTVATVRLPVRASV